MDIIDSSPSAVPVVFLSSVVFGLEVERQAIATLITSFGWHCDVSGLSEHRIWGSPEDACYRRVENADLYIGIFQTRSGSKSYAYESFVTEMEFYRALNARRPMRVYLLLGRDAPDDDLKHFLNYIKLEVYVRTCHSQAELIRCVSEDLYEFDGKWKTGQTQTLVPPLHLDQGLRNAGAFEREALGFGLRAPNSRTRESLGERVLYMENLYARHKFAEASTIGTALLPNFLTLNLSYKTSRELLYLWARFLQTWAKSCIWLGYVIGDYGAIRASLLLKEANRMLEAWHEFDETDGLVANAYYVLASRLQIRKARLGTNTFFEIGTGAQNALKRALIFDERHAHRTQSPMPHLHRAHVNLELGDYDRAIADFRTMLNYGSRLNDRSYYDYLTSLGQALVMKGVTQELQTLIQDGCVLLQRAKACLPAFDDSPFFLIYMKRITKTYIRIGEIDFAKALLDELYPIALQRKLSHQAEGIEALISVVQNNKPSHLYH